MIVSDIDCQKLNRLPVCVLRCACRDFSLGNTRLHILHLMLLGVLDPSTIREEILSALGLPRRSLKSLSLSGDPQELPGLSAMFCAPKPQFHGYIIASLKGGLFGIPSGSINIPFPLFGDMKAGFKDMFRRKNIDRVLLLDVNRRYPVPSKWNFARYFAEDHG